MSAKQELLEARELIKAKRYREARIILQTLDDPTARQWLARIDEIESQQSSDAAISSHTAARARPPTSTLPSHAETRRITSITLLLLLVMAAGGGILTGIALYLSSNLMYLIFLSPAIGAAIAGGLIAGVVRLGKVRAMLIVGLLAAVSGAITYGTYRYAEYLGFQQEVRDLVLADYPNADPQEVDAFLDEILFEEVGDTGFIGFIKLEAQEGMTVSSRRSGFSENGGNTWSEGATVAYWGAEVLIMLIVPAVIAMGSAAADFCEETGQWLKMPAIGRIDNKSMDAFLQLLANGQLEEARSLVGSKGPMTVFMGRCSEHSPEARLKITVQRGRNTREVTNTSVPAEVYRMLTGDI